MYKNIESCCGSREFVEIKYNDQVGYVATLWAVERFNDRHISYAHGKTIEDAMRNLNAKLHGLTIYEIRS